MPECQRSEFLLRTSADGHERFLAAGRFAVFFLATGLFRFVAVFLPLVEVFRFAVVLRFVAVFLPLAEVFRLAAGRFCLAVVLRFAVALRLVVVVRFAADFFRAGDFFFVVFFLVAIVLNLWLMFKCFLLAFASREMSRCKMRVDNTTSFKKSNKEFFLNKFAKKILLSDSLLLKNKTARRKSKKSRMCLYGFNLF